MKKTAVVIIDVQKGMFLENDPVYNGQPLLHNIKNLIALARLNHSPIFYIQHHSEKGGNLEYGSHNWEIHSEIAPILPNDIVIHKHTPDSFFKTSFDEVLRNRDINHLVIAGIQSEICVDTTTRSAYSNGYDITVVSDAHSTWDSKHLSARQIINHHNNLLRWFADVKKTNEIYL